MQVQRDSVGPVAVVRVLGRLDSVSSPVLQAELLPGLTAPGERLVLDLTRTDYVSSAGLQVILLAAKQTRALKGGFAVFGLAETVRRVFDLSGFSRVITVAADEAEAVAAAGG